MNIYITVMLSIFQGTVKSIFSDLQNNFVFLFRGMKYNSISRIQYHSVIRSPKTKTVIIQHNGKNIDVVTDKHIIDIGILLENTVKSDDEMYYLINS